MTNLSDECRRTTIMYMAACATYNWGSACSGTDSPSWVFVAMGAVFLHTAFSNIHAAEILAAKRAWIKRTSKPRHLFRCVLALTRRKADCDQVGPVELADLPWPLDLFIAGFSCKDVSHLNVFKWQKFQNNVVTHNQGTTGSTLLGVLCYLWQRRPRTFILENVPGLAEHLHLVLDRCAAAGYLVMWRMFNSLRVGVPHDRDRIWLLGWRLDIIKIPHAEFRSRVEAAWDALLEDHPLMAIDDFLYPEGHRHILRGHEDEGKLHHL